MTGEQHQSSSTFYFPLRTNVQYFAAPESFLSLEQRVKQALILYDRIVFESGLYVGLMGPDGAFDFHVPAHMRDTQSRSTSLGRQPDLGFSVWIQPGGPGTAPQQVIASSTEYSITAEFDGFIRKLVEEFGVEGVEVSDTHISQNGKGRAKRLATSYLRSADAVLPEGSDFSQSRIVQNLFQDLLVASALGYAMGIDSLHAPILNRLVRTEGGLLHATGFSALEFQVPNAASLSWEQIADLRKDSAIVNFRQKLLRVEHKVREALPDGSEAEVQLEIGKILNKELIKEVQARMAPTGWKLARGVVAQIAGGLIQPIGTIQTAYSVGKDVVDSIKEQRSWLAVLMKFEDFATE
jgi:hypothetical protein